MFHLLMWLLQLYLPKNPLYEASSSEARPPLLIKIDGGPTSSVNTTFRIDIQYWTSRGFAVCDVDYGGSTGYGREYRQPLRFPANLPNRL